MARVSSGSDPNQSSNGGGGGSFVIENSVPEARQGRMARVSI
jgi:hypothetical protein